MKATKPIKLDNDTLTAKVTAFRSFNELLTAKDYTPTLRGVGRMGVLAVELANRYDAAQEQRGDSRRAYRGC